MSRTPDRVETELLLAEQGAGNDPDEEGGVRYSDGAFRMKDAVGVYDPRKPLVPVRTGQVIYAARDATFRVETPLIGGNGIWLSNRDGVLLVTG
jgi:hypothetical protein